jgi:hypothetical protein
MTRALTAEQRTDHIAALKAARAISDRDEIANEFQGCGGGRDYTPIVISAGNSISNGAVDPDLIIELSGDTFAAALASEDEDNWSVTVGTTGLTLASISRDGNGQCTLSFTGTAAEGSITVKALAAALTNGYMASNRITVAVPAA